MLESDMYVRISITAQEHHLFAMRDDWMLTVTSIQTASNDTIHGSLLDHSQSVLLLYRWCHLGVWSNEPCPSAVK